jgi:C-terminal processing protease CtpA/Prc
MFYYDSLKFESYLLDEREKRKLEFEREKNINFGFTKVEILEANLGYIQMVKFSDFSDDVAKKKIASIMNFVQHTNALIIDLRFNSGGQGETIDLFSSYFLSNKGTTINNSDQYISKPIYILTSNGTFSAAEKFTSLLQESKRAIVIGEKTIGGGHSGRSVSILDGFLAFIPTGGENDPLENIGVTPDYPIKESETLIYAKYLYFKSLKSETNSEEYAKTLWYMENCKYLMKIDNDDVDIFKSEFVGEYEGNRTIILKDNKPFLSTKNNSYPLVQINMQEFIIDGDDYFGKGNSRISFNTDKSKPGIEHRVFVNDKINSKYFNKK